MKYLAAILALLWSCSTTPSEIKVEWWVARRAGRALHNKDGPAGRNVPAGSETETGVEMMNVKQIVENHLRANGFDGLSNDGCGCGLDDLMPCDFDYNGMPDCKPAKHHDCDGTCSGCCSTGPNDRADNCYRAAQAETHEEETHL